MLRLSRITAILAVLFIIVFGMGAGHLRAHDRHRVVVSDATYAMSDTDTLAAAERAVLLRAQQKAVEEAGIYLESSFSDIATSTGERSTQTSLLSIRTVAAAIIGTEILEQKTMLENDRPIFSIKIKSIVDIERLEEAIRRLQRQELYTRHFHQLNAENAALKTELRELRRELHRGVRSPGNPVVIESAAELTQRALRTDSWSEKISLASQAITANRHETEAYIIRGQTLLHVGSLSKNPGRHVEDRDWFFERAKADFSQAATLSPTNTWALFGRAEILAMQGRYEAALGDYQQVLQIDPLFDLARQQMSDAALQAAKAHMARHQWSAALGPLDQLLGQEPLPTWIPFQSEAYLLRSRIQTTLGRPEAALKDLETVLSGLPAHRDALFQRGKVNQKLGEKRRAVEDFAMACNLGMQLACSNS